MKQPKPQPGQVPRSSEDGGPPSPAAVPGSNKVAPPSRAWSWVPQRRRVYFVLGIVAGITLATLGLNYQREDGTTGLDLVQQQILDLSVIPSAVQYQIQHLLDPYSGGRNFTRDLGRPGMKLAAEGMASRHPVLMVPGIVTTGLEIWKGSGCGKDYFRQRVWGTSSMLAQFLRDKECWLQHMALDSSELTRGCGLDPSDVKVRPAQGFEATDYVIGGFWVWAKLIENLADIGYDMSSMAMASFDWRLAFQDLERRDTYFSRTKRLCETLVDSAKHRQREERRAAERRGGPDPASASDDHYKIAVVTHSMGAQVWVHFMQWVEVQEPGWIDKHIDSFVSLGGPLLGTPAALPRLISGEIKDVAEMGVLGKLLDLYVPPLRRRSLMRSWGSVYQLLPRGGSLVWGDPHSDEKAPDDLFEPPVCRIPGNATSEAPPGVDPAPSVPMQDPDAPMPSLAGMMYIGDKALSVEETFALFLDLDPLNSSSSTRHPPLGEYATQLQGNRVSFGNRPQPSASKTRSAFSWASTSSAVSPTARSSGVVESHKACGHDQSDDFASRSWGNPLEHPLPAAPNMKIACLYGVGMPTERGYHYGKLEPPAVQDKEALGGQDSAAPDSASRTPPQPELLINASASFGRTDCTDGLAPEPASSTAPAPAERAVNALPGMASSGAGPTYRAPVPHVRKGIAYADGDKLIPLVSLGLMCANHFGWGDPAHQSPARVRSGASLNPAGSPVTIREYLHQPRSSFETVRDPINRGGPGASDHVDIMGNHQVIQDILVLAATGALPERRVYSDIDSVAKRVAERAETMKKRE